MNLLLALLALSIRWDSYENSLERAVQMLESPWLLTIWAHMRKIKKVGVFFVCLFVLCVCVCVLPLFSFSSLLVIFWTYLQSSILSSSLITLFWPICMYLFCLSIKILIAQPTEEIMDLNHTHTMCQASRSNTKDYTHAQFLSQVRLFETPWM